MADPWAILLIHFSDNETEPFEKSWYEELFTESGAGKWGFFDWFRDNSHGRADLTGSKVFGWYKLDMKAAEYTGSGANQQGRSELVEKCKKKARDEKVPLDDFVGTVVVLNSGRDLFGGAAGAVGGDDGMNQDVSGLAVGIMAQEMCHVYGLQHSKQLGSPEDYMDPWDIMSALRTLNSPSPTLTARTPRGDAVYPIGPGLNAANMWSRGWLDESRTWVAPSGGYIDEEITLRPLHRRDLPGYLAARFQDLFIEFRVPEDWDAEFGQAAIFVHDFDQGTSWLVADSKENFEWTTGSKNGIEGYKPPPHIDFGMVSLTIQNIDPAERTATVRFFRTRGAGAEKYFPEWWPKKKLWPDLERVFPEDSFIITPTEVLRIPHASPIRDVINGISDGISRTQRRTLGSARIERVIRTASFVDSHPDDVHSPWLPER